MVATSATGVAELWAFMDRDWAAVEPLAAMIPNGRGGGNVASREGSGQQEVGQDGAIEGSFLWGGESPPFGRLLICWLTSNLRGFHR